MRRGKKGGTCPRDTPRLTSRMSPHRDDFSTRAMSRIAESSSPPEVVPESLATEELEDELLEELVVELGFCLELPKSTCENVSPRENVIGCGFGVVWNTPDGSTSTTR